MKKNFRISLLSQSKPPEFCVHNALRKQATCYLRLPEDPRLVEWCHGGQANDFVKDIQRTQELVTDQRVFQSSLDFDLYQKETKVLAALIELIRIEFEDIKSDKAIKRVLETCFGEEVALPSPTPSPRPRRSAS
jgi:hypothetical protein